MFNSSLNYSEYNVETLILINNLYDLLLVSKEPVHLKIWMNNLNNFFLCNGSEMEYNQKIYPVSLLKGIDYNKIFISNSRNSYPFYYVVRPSLYNQFNLIKQVSIILRQSKSQPLFLLIIRLNMLLLVWSSNYFNQPIKKIFYLIDYLINLKLRLYIKRTASKYFLTISFSNHNLSVCYSNYLLSKKHHIISVIVKNSKLYKCYFLMKLCWLYKLKC